MNDVYLIKDDSGKHALRVWRKSWRDVDDVRYELNFLDFLRSRNFAASTALRTRDDALYFKVNSPEGERAVALYTWAPGRKFGERLDERTAERIGALFAEMHLLGSGVQREAIVSRLTTLLVSWSICRRCSNFSMTGRRMPAIMRHWRRGWSSDCARCIMKTFR